MIFCKKCNYEITRALEYCPNCRAKLEFNEAEIRELGEYYSAALADKEYESAVEYCRILANSGKLEYEREYGRMLERGSLVARDYDEAMKYFLSAAKKLDAWSAYRYSRLVSRGNARAGRFWLLFSAVLACPEAYPKAAELLSKEGDQKSANFFYIESAKHDDVDSIVELASRYYKGIHIEADHHVAKWYMEKLTFPPFHAFRLAYKLRGVTSSEPEEYIYDREPLIRALAAEASQCGFREAYCKLEAMLSELGDTEAITVSAMLKIDGIGCEKNVDEAIRLFTEAAAQGSADAYACLAEIFIGGEYQERCPELAVHYYEEAGALGSAEAYEALAVLYDKGEYIGKSVSKALEYYDRAANLGSSSAERRGNEIRAERDKLFRDGMTALSENPRRGFRALAIAAAMGHTKAPLKLAECYLRGVGVEPDRYSAYYWFKSAHEAHDERATYPLALCYFNGVGVNRDLKRAKALLTEAASRGSEGAKITLKKLMEAKRKKLSRKLYSKGMRLIHLKKFEKARELLELSARLKNAKATYTLGTIYEFGLGIQTDRHRASLYYDESYALGYSDLGTRYKRIILKLIR